MKTLVNVLFSAALAVTACSAAEPMHRAKIVKVSAQIQQTPQFQFNGPKDKTYTRRYWVEIEAEIEIETTDPTGYIAEMEAKWFAVLMDKHSHKPVRLLGTVKFKNLRAAERRAYLSAYIDPDTIERITGKARASESDLKGVALMLSGPGIDTAGRLAEGLAKASSEEKGKWWVDWKDPDLPGLIVAKSMTPFAVLWTDRYPIEKPATP